ncbi:MAG: hypothetical protein BMS9Abin37_0145 [Acidobacteriota bacterium]|nr:MAG: hypothetical protein BMS9Abin37_0145 [Acidobacteriota bacterium]
MSNSMNSFFKRSVLALVAGVVALTFAQTGHTAAPCLISRGLDPLDVLNSGVRHNVWIVLDSSGSMGSNFGGGQTRMQVARDVLTEVIDEFIDASGRPLVNWGFVRFARNSRNSSSECNAQFTNGCVGLNLSALIDPPACDQPDSSGSIKAALAGAVQSNGRPVDGGWTPNGISMDQISKEIVNKGFVSGLLPNQKNFVILVTDGDDTCECGGSGNASGRVRGIWTPTAVPPFTAPSVTIPNQLRGGNVDSSYTVTESSSSDRRAINAGSKGRLFYERLNPTATDRATGAKGGSFVIGLGLGGGGQRRANHMAWEASGAYYSNPNAFHALFANDKAALKDALRNAFAKIGVPATEVTLGAPIVGSVREVIPTYTNTSVSPGDHIGDVGPALPDQDDIRQARKVRGNHRDNVLFSTSVELPGFKGHFKAQSIFKVDDPLNPRTVRSADFRQIWDAGELLRDRLGGPDSRNLLFNRRGETLLRDFTIANVTAADLGVGAGFLSEIDGVGALNANDARDMVVQVIRGYRLSKHPVTNLLYDTGGNINFSEFEADGVTPTWKLYDSVAGSAVMPYPTRSPDFDPTQNHAAKYGVGGSIAGDGFYWDNFNRQTMVYLPSNGGILHAFDAETGDEVFGYLPDDVLGLDPAETPRSRDTLSDLVQLIVAENNGIANHQFFLSGSPTVGDVFLRQDFGGDDQWHSMVTFGRGRGGRFVTGLDVTDPLNPKLRFNVGNRENMNDNELDGMGETWSTPVIGNVLTDSSFTNEDRVDQWVVFMGGGYGCNNSYNEGQYLFAIRLEDGSVHYAGKVTNDPSAAIPYNALVAMPRLYNPHQEDTSDSNDYITRLYIGDVQGRVWKLVTKDQDPTNWTLGVFAELGIDQPITAPLSLVPDLNAKQVYVMVGTGGDQRINGTTTDFKFVGLRDDDVVGDNNLQYPLGSAALWERTLNPEERVYVAPAVIGQISNATPPIVFFAASKPTFNTITCESEFFSSLWAVEIFGGLAYVDLDGTGIGDNVDLGQSKVAGIYARGSNLYVSETGGLGSSGTLSVYGDGEFEDGPTGSGGGFSIQVMIDGFRMSPF